MFRSRHVNRAYEARDRYFADRTDENLDQAVSLLTTAMWRFQPGSIDYERASLAGNLGNLVLERFQRTKQLDDVDTAVMCLREAIADGRGPQIMLLSRLADAHEARYVVFLQDEDIAEAARLRIEVVRGLPPGDPEAAGHVMAFDRAMQLRTVVNGLPEHEQHAVPDDAERNRRAGKLLTAGMSAVDSFDESHDPRELDAAVRLVRHGVGIAVDRRMHLGLRAVLAWVLLRRYELNRDTADVDEMVKLWHDLAEVPDLSHGYVPPRHILLDAQARALGAAFRHTGALRYLEQAIAYGKRAEQAYPADEDGHFIYLYNLSISTGDFAETTGGDGETSLRLLEQATAACPDTHPKKYLYLARLARLRAQANRLDEAVWLGREAVRLAGTGHRDRAAALNGLAAVLLARGRQRTVEGDLTEATRHLDEVVVITQGPQRYDALADLAVCHVARYEVLGDENSRQAAVVNLREVAEWPLGSPTQRSDAAREWGVLERLAGNWSQAAEAYEKAVELLGQTAPGSIPVADRHRLLGERHGLASDAAACFLKLGNVARAVELLELGRGIMLGRGIEARDDTTRLAEAHPALAADFERLRAAVDAMDTQEDYVRAFDVAGSVSPNPAEQRAVPAVDDFGWRQRLIAERDAKLAEIRALEGFERFLLAPQAEELLAATSDGPIVVVNTAYFRCDAVIIYNGRFDLIELPDITVDSIHDTLQQKEGEDAFMWFDRIAAELWDSMIGKVVARLVRTGCTRVWWCPTGVLSWLPVHAAGRHDRPGESVLDHFVSSYTPTIRALVYARNRQRCGSDRVLAVGMPETPEAEPLPSAAREVGTVREAFGEATLTFTGPEAKADKVRDALSDVRLAHFACHAQADQDNPSTGHLRLADGNLTVGEVSRLRLPSAELVVLSACESADSGSATRADEAVSLASAFLLAGFPEVVAGLWPVTDIAAKKLVRDFYAGLTDEPGSAARALHNAVLRYRRKRPEHAIMWAPFVHVGR